MSNGSYMVVFDKNVTGLNTELLPLTVGQNRDYHNLFWLHSGKDVWKAELGSWRWQKWFTIDLSSRGVEEEFIDFSALFVVLEFCFMTITVCISNNWLPICAKVGYFSLITPCIKLPFIFMNTLWVENWLSICTKVGYFNFIALCVKFRYLLMVVITEKCR